MCVSVCVKGERPHAGMMTVLHSNRLAANLIKSHSSHWKEPIDSVMITRAEWPAVMKCIRVLMQVDTARKLTRTAINLNLLYLNVLSSLRYFKWDFNALPDDCLG